MVLLEAGFVVGCETALQHLHPAVVTPAGSMFRSFPTEAAQEGADFKHHTPVHQLLKTAVLVHDAVVGLFHDPDAPLVHDEGDQQHAPGR